MKTDAPMRVVSRTIAVLKAINRTQSLSITEMAARTGMPYATAYRIVETLVAEGLVEREPGRKRYRPTPLVQTLSAGFADHDRVVTVGRPHIVGLTARIHWPAAIVTRVGHQMINRDSTQNLTTLSFDHFQPGHSQALLDGPTGIAHLAFSSAAEREALLTSLRTLPEARDHEMLRLLSTPAFIERTRAEGYVSHSRSRINPKTFAIAVPIMADEEVAGILAVIFFVSVIKVDDAVSRHLEDIRAAAAAITRDMAAGGGAVYPRHG